MSQGGTYRSQNENFDIGSPKNEEISEVWMVGLKQNPPSCEKK